jgi:hypothetical protein
MDSRPLPLRQDDQGQSREAQSQMHCAGKAEIKRENVTKEEGKAT